jgi:hypothetical protein
MSDLTALLMILALLGVAMVCGVVVVSLRRRDHRRQEGDEEETERAIGENR